MGINLKYGKYIIYALKDPISNEIRYVGKSTSGLKRPKIHLMPSSYNSLSKKHFHVYCWIRGLIEKNLKPEIIVLKACDSDNLNSEEVRFIDFYKSEGCNLTNLVNGGNGMLGLKHTQEAKDKISKKLTGRVRSKEEIEKQSKSISGKNHWNYGKKASEKTRERQSESHKGMVQSEESRFKKSLSMKGRKRGKMRDDHKDKLRLAKRNKMKPVRCVDEDIEFESIRSAARYFNIDKSYIQRSIGKSKPCTKTGFTFVIL